MKSSAKVSWTIWSILAVISLTYIIFSAKSFRIHGKVADMYDRFEGGDEKQHITNSFRGGRAACVLSMIAVIAYAAYTLTYTIKDWATNGVLNGVMYGILMTASLYSSAFMLLVGVVLQSNDYLIELNERNADASNWQRDNNVAFVLAYLLTGIYAASLVYHVVHGIFSTSNSTAPTKPAASVSHIDASPSML